MGKLQGYSCYRVLLPCTNATKTTGITNDPREEKHEYIDTIDGYVYVICPSMQDAADKFPYALSIERVGTGYAC